MEDLERLLFNVSACSDGLKNSADSFVGALQSIKQASLQCESDLREKQTKAGETIEGLRSEIASLNDQRRALERQLQMLRDRIEREKRDFGREKDRLMKTMDEWLLAQPQP